MTSNYKILYFIKHEKSIILMGLIAGLVLAAGYLLMLYRPVYSSDAKIYIRNIPKSDVITTYGDSGSFKSESGYSNPLFNYREILTSESLATRTYPMLEQSYSKELAKLGVHSEAQWENKFGKIITTKVVPSTDIIKIDFKWSDKETTQKVFKLLIAEFKDLNLEIRKQHQVSNRKYLDEQLNRINNELNNVRAQIRTYRQQTHSIDIPNESIELTRARIELEKQAQLLKSQSAFNQAKLSDISKQLGMQNAQTALKAVGVGNDPLILELNQSLAAAQQNYAKLKSKFKDEYPAVKEVKSQVESLKASIENRTSETLGSSKMGRGIYDPASASIVTDMARTQADSVSVTAQMRALQKGISSLQQQERLLPNKQLGLDMLVKKEHALLLAYEQVSAKQMEAHLQESMIADNVVLLSRPSNPSWDMTELFVKLLVLTMLCTLGGLAAAWIKYDMEDKWLEPGEIEAVTGHKILGSMPWVKPEDYKVTATYFEGPKSIQGIAYGNMANALIARSYLTDSRIISFMATTISRKDSPITHNIAAMLSRLNKTVLLVDTDLEKPGKLLSALNVAPIQGGDLVNLILNTQSQIRLSQQVDEEALAEAISAALIPIACPSSQPEEQNTFYYLAAKQSNSNIHELLALPAFKRILDILKKKYEFILLDAPSKPLIYPEVETIANVSDASVLISSMESSKQDLIKAIGYLEKNNNQLMGIIPREKDNELAKYVELESKQIFKPSKNDLQSA